MNEKIVIKKYENRRLYDTNHSQYVNLEAIAGMIREGAKLQVLDAKTGEDLTRLVLTQIIVEEAKGSREFTLPLDILRQLVIASGRATQEGWSQYMKALSEFYQNAYNAYKAYTVPSTPFEVLRARIPQSTANPWFFFMHPASQAAARRVPGTEAETATTNESREAAEQEFANLRERIEELERRLINPEPGRRRTSKRP